MFEPGVAGLAKLERQTELCGRGLRLVVQLGRRRLGEPDDTLVVAEVVVAQLGMTVEPEPAPDDPVERAHEEIGQVVRARLVLHAAEELVAVGARKARQVVERAARAAVRVGDDVAVRRIDGRADPLGPVVQLGRQRAHLDVPAAALRDLVDVERERAAGDDDCLIPGT